MLLWKLFPAGWLAWYSQCMSMSYLNHWHVLKHPLAKEHKTVVFFKIQPYQTCVNSLATFCSMFSFYLATKTQISEGFPALNSIPPYLKPDRICSSTTGKKQVKFHLTSKHHPSIPFVNPKARHRSKAPPEGPWSTTPWPPPRAPRENFAAWKATCSLQCDLWWRQEKYEEKVLRTLTLCIWNWRLIERHFCELTVYDTSWTCMECGGFHKTRSDEVHD